MSAPVPALATTLALAAWLIALPSLAARPLVGETADVLNGGDCELETAAVSTRARGEPLVRAVETLAACGAGHATELNAAYLRSRSAGQTAQGLTLGGKTTLVEVADDRTGFAVAYALAIEQAPGGGWHHGNTRLFGVATRALTANLQGHLNLGWLRLERERLDHATWLLGVEGEGPVRWAADLYGDGRTPPWLSAGLVWALADKVSASLAYAQQFESKRAHQWTLGLKFDF